MIIRGRIQISGNRDGRNLLVHHIHLHWCKIQFLCSVAELLIFFDQSSPKSLQNQSLQYLKHYFPPVLFYISPSSVLFLRYKCWPDIGIQVCFQIIWIIYIPSLIVTQEPRSPSFTMVSVTWLLCRHSFWMLGSLSQVMFPLSMFRQFRV